MPDALSPQDRDAVTRMILSEAGQDGPDGMAAVASVVKNRVQSGQFGATPSAVVAQPNAFTAWSLPKGDPNSPTRWSAKDPQYQKAAALVDSVWSGKVPDTTGGADHYFSPTLQAAQGRPVPDWAQGQPTAKVGSHVFYAPNGPVAPDLLGSWGAQPQAPAAIPSALPATEPPDLLGSWGAKPDVTAGTAAPLRITIHPAGYQPPPGQETPAEWTNRMLA